MNYPFTKIEFSQYCEDENKRIINQYWEIENNNFKFRPTELATENTLTAQQLSKLVKSNSECFLHIEKCSVCANDISIKVTSQSTARKHLENRKYDCDTCKEKFRTRMRENGNEDYKAHRMQYAFDNKFWTKLTREEFDILKKIAELDNYAKFKKQFLNKNYDIVWPIIHKLDNLGLIDIRGIGYENRPITQLYFLPELVMELDVRPNANVTFESNLTFNIPKHPNRQKATQPHFMKRVVFDKDIVLEQGKEYFCSIWKNEDGSLNLGIKAKSDLPNKSKDEIDYEPKSIGEIISKMRK